MAIDLTSFNMKFDPFMKGIWEMVACDNRTSDSAIPPGLFWPCILMRVEKEVQTPGNLSSKGTDLLYSQSAPYTTFSFQQSDKLILELPFCFPEMILSLFHFTTQEKLNSLM